jgi:hypothetical protein
LRAELENLERSPRGPTRRISQLREILETVTIVEAPDELDQSVAF